MSVANLSQQPYSRRSVSPESVCAWYVSPSFFTPHPIPSHPIAPLPPSSPPPSLASNPSYSPNIPTPETPCHRVISSTGHIAGYKGEWSDAPSGINQSRKLDLLREEGLEFTEEGMLIVEKAKGAKGIMFDGPWVVD